MQFALWRIQDPFQRQPSFLKNRSNFMLQEVNLCGGQKLMVEKIDHNLPVAGRLDCQLFLGLYNIEAREQGRSENQGGC